MFCPKCGAEIQEGVQFCKECGARIESAGKDAPSQHNRESSFKQKIIAGIVISIIGWLILLYNILFSQNFIVAMIALLMIVIGVSLIQKYKQAGRNTNG